MDFKRAITATIGLPAVILAIVLGNKYLMALIISLASIICMYEYFLVIKKVSKPIKWVGYLSNAFVLLPAFLEVNTLFKVLIFLIPIIILFIFLQIIGTDMKTSFKDAAYTLLGVFYIPFFLMFLELLRCSDNGKILIGYTFIVSWGTDIFAFLIGLNFGKHTFSKISPKKSIEGCVAGVIGAIILTIIYTFFINKYLNTEFSYLVVILSAFILSIISQIGDFAASSIKRFVDTKDFGNLLPGHGGMLDRIDSLIFIAPFTYFIFLLL